MLPLSLYKSNAVVNTAMINLKMMTNAAVTTYGLC